MVNKQKRITYLQVYPGASMLNQRTESKSRGVGVSHCVVTVIKEVLDYLTLYLSYISYSSYT